MPRAPAAGPPAAPPELMHATQVAQPFHTPGWVYEEKYDGWRMLVVKDVCRVGAEVVASSFRDITAHSQCRRQR